MSLHPSSAELVAQAQALCAAAANEPTQPLRLRLPHLNLALRTPHTDYLELCLRALVDMPDAVAASAPELSVLVTDQSQRNDLRAPTFDTPAAGQGALLSALRHASMDGCHDTEFNSWQFFQPQTGVGIQLQKAPGHMPPWESAFPLRNFLHWHYAHQGRRMLHAGTLGLHGQGVLLAGAGGAGKSGTTLAGVLCGLQSVGDDYIGLDPTLPVPHAFPLMRLMKQDARGLTRLGLEPDPARFGELNWQNKHEFDFEHLKPGSRAPQLALQAVLLPRVTGAARSTLRPATRREVLFALLPNNLQQLPGHADQAMHVLTDLTRRLPGYHLDLSADPQEISDTIRTFLEQGTP